MSDEAFVSTMSKERRKEIGEIAIKIAPVARKYGLRYVWLFGSRARGDARPDSDVDLLITREGSSVKSLLDLSGLYIDFQRALGTELDLVTLEALDHELNRDRPSSRRFRENIDREKVIVYGVEERLGEGQRAP
ncbi:MAG: nucleotidyltransferase domain-containing protein [Synergistaceae bacterium]|nr:nucleotidyltransferase domain-containing protein [Synergistaceae bacterium]